MDIGQFLHGETLICEYKEDREDRDRNAGLSEDKIAEALMALSNADGGHLLLGVRSRTGEVTGIHENRRENAETLCVKIRRKFVHEPELEYWECFHQGKKVFVFRILATTSTPHQLRNGILKIRKDEKKKDGPEDLPFPVGEIAQWEAQRGRHTDFSSRLQPTLLLSEWRNHLNPVAVGVFQERLRTGRINNSTLGGIGHFEEQLVALGLVGTVNNDQVLNNAALLLFGSDEVVRRFIPHHRIQFQVFGPEGAVVHNLFSDRPGLEHRCILYLANRLDELLKGVIQRKEISDGLFRIDVPDYGDAAVREAILNAFCHRDYTHSEEIIIQITAAVFTVSSPGGFYRDVNPQNILFHEPCSRNRCLAQACADLGLVEKSGRGVDRIFWDQIQYLRPLPSYAESTSGAVRLVLMGGRGSLEIIKWMFEFFAKQDDLQIRVVHGGLIHILMMEGKCSREEMIAALPGLSENQGKRAITELIEKGIFARVGQGRGQKIVFSEKFNTVLGKPEAYQNQLGLEESAMQKKILDALETKEKISRKQAAEILHIDSDTATFRFLKKMVVAGLLRTEGRGSGTRYHLRQPNEQELQQK